MESRLFARGPLGNIPFSIPAERKGYRRRGDREKNNCAKRNSPSPRLPVSCESLSVVRLGCPAHAGPGGLTRRLQETGR
jgi:hypothetical protein